MIHFFAVHHLIKDIQNFKQTNTHLKGQYKHPWGKRKKRFLWLSCSWICFCLLLLLLEKNHELDGFPKFIIWNWKKNTKIKKTTWLHHSYIAQYCNTKSYKNRVSATCTPLTLFYIHLPGVDLAPCPPKLKQFFLKFLPI